MMTNIQLNIHIVYLILIMGSAPSHPQHHSQGNISGDPQQTPRENPYRHLKPVDKKAKQLHYECFSVQAVGLEDQHDFALAKCIFEGNKGAILQMSETLKTKHEDLQNPLLIIVHHIEPYVEAKGLTHIIGDLFSSKKHLVFFTDLMNVSADDKAKTAQFNEQELGILIDCISKAMELLQEQKIYFCGISPKRVFEVVTPFNEKVFKFNCGISYHIHDHHYPQWLDQYVNHGIIDHVTLLDSTPPPEVLKAIKDHKQFHDANHFKWDVFSFGILVLQCAVDFDIAESLYENQILDIDATYIKELITRIPLRYQPVVSRMLELNEDLRPDWLQLAQEIDQLFGDQRILTVHQNTEFYFGHEYTKSLKHKEKREQTLVHHQYYLDIDVNSKIFDEQKPVSSFQLDEALPIIQNPVVASVIRNHEQEKPTHEKNKSLVISKMETNRVKRERSIRFDPQIQFAKLPILAKSEAAQKLTQMTIVK